MAKLSNILSWNKLCVDHIGPYNIYKNGNLL